jgi:cytochrome bd-type quinol oxidase subunit 2
MAAISAMPAAWRWPGALAWFVLAVLGMAGAQAQAPSVPLERQVKAAYLIKFAGFVEWPEASFARPDSVLQIGVAGNGALAELLAGMAAGRSINGHRLAVRRVQPGEALTDLHILFVDASLDSAAARVLLSATSGLALLTVSDADQTADSDCMIHFVVEADRLRFDVLMRPVAASRLRISARMLAVAHRVRGAS